MEQREKLAWLTRPSMQLKTARVSARWRDDFDELYNKTDPKEAAAYPHDLATNPGNTVCSLAQRANLGRGLGWRFRRPVPVVTARWQQRTEQLGPGS